MIIAAGVAANFGALAVLAVGKKREVCIAKRMRRWEGFNPSRASGRAREMMTDIE
jgi:hypothetical protein